MVKVWAGFFLASLASGGLLVHGEEVDDTIGTRTTLTPTALSFSAEAIVCDGNLTCPQIYSPVCTSNGRTYSNPCQFKNAYCESPSDTFYIVANGTCKDDVPLQVQSVDDDENQGFSFTKEVVDVPIEIDSVTSPTINDSDGIEAPVVDGIPVEGSVDVENATGKSSPSYDCDSGDLTCDGPNDPVCASNGYTYSNECQFKNAYCESLSESLFIVSKGPCDNNEAPIQVQSTNEDVWGVVFDVPVELDQSSALRQPTAADCEDGRINCALTDGDIPVCSSDGRKFSNYCLFVKAFCENPDSGLRVTSEGDACATNIQVQSTNEGVSSDVLNVPIELDEVAVDADVYVHSSHHRSNAYCTLECPTGAVAVEPICGTDSRSYINPCHLLSSKCESPDLEKQYGGLCIVGQVSSTGLAPSITAQETAADCNPYCGKEFAPVCGSNGVTYGNECLFAFANCQDAKVTRLGNGSCSELYQGATQEARGEGTTSCVPSACPGTEAPVCGSDGETYLNACMLSNAKCEIPQLSVVHEGACGRQTRLTCATLTCRRHKRCEDGNGRLRAHCVDVCHADRCGPNETCKLLQSDCLTAPCSPVATCVPNDKAAGEFY